MSDLSSRDPQPGRARTALAVGCVIALAIAVRAWGLSTQSLTMDEFAELSSAKLSLGEILHTRDGFPPLYGFLLHGWLALFPDDLAARWLSVVTAALAVAAMYQLGEQLGVRGAGIGAALALALSPFHVWFSQEIRAYALYLLFAVVAIWLFFRAMSSNRYSDWLLYALACAAGMYTHYFFALLAITAGLILLVEKRWTRDLLPAVTGNAVFALACLPLIGLLREDLSYQAGSRLEAPFTLAAAGYTYFSAGLGFSVGPSLRELHSLTAGDAVRLALPWGLIAATTLGVLAYIALVTVRPRSTAIRLLAFAIVPVIAGGILTEAFGVGYRVRYVAWVAMPCLALIGVGLAAARHRTRALVAAIALVALWGVAIGNRHTNERYWNEDLRALTSFIHSNSDPSVPVFVMSDYMAVPIEYYLGTGWTVCALPNLDTGSRDTTGPRRVIATNAPADSTFWFVYTREFHSDPEGSVPPALVASGLMRPRARFAGVALFEGRTRPQDRELAPLTCQDPNPMPE